MQPGADLARGLPHVRWSRWQDTFGDFPGGRLGFECTEGGFQFEMWGADQTIHKL